MQQLFQPCFLAESAQKVLMPVSYGSMKGRLSQVNSTKAGITFGTRHLASFGDAALHELGCKVLLLQVPLLRYKVR